jgi:hypothetical protein
MKTRRSTRKPATGIAGSAKYDAKTSRDVRKVAKKYTSPKIDLEGIQKEFYRADLLFDGVDHAGASYEGRVFLNNPKADDETPTTLENGYAGRYHIFGHGGCFGDVGHCEVNGPRRPYDPRYSHPLTPASKIVIATEAIRRAINQGQEMTVTVVPIITSGTKLCDYENTLKFDNVSVVAYA